MRYLKISKNYYIEGKNTLKKGNPIYPFVNLNVDNNGNRIGVFTDKLIISEDTEDDFEQFIIQYLRAKNSSYNSGSQISTDYVTRKQLYRIKGIQNLENLSLQDLNITELNFAKYFKNLKNFVFPKDGYDYSNKNFILHRPPTNVISLCTNNYQYHNEKKDSYKKNNNHRVKLNYNHKELKINNCKITYLNNINKYYNHLPANFLCGLQNENINIKAGIIEEFQNTKNYTNAINNLNIECSSMKPLAFYKSAIQNMQLKFDDNSKGIIRNSAFYGSKIQQASFYNVQRIEFGAFSHCKNLREIHIHSQNPVWLESYCFYDCYNLTDIYFDYPPKIAYGKGLPYKNHELIYPNVCVHGKYSGKFYIDGQKIIDISNYCYFIFKMFYGTYRTNGHLNIHIKNKNWGENLYNDFVWKINEYNKQNFIDHNYNKHNNDRYCTINII